MEHNAQRQRRPLRVLVADDNHDAAESLAALIELWGHDVRVAYHGRSALTSAQAFHPEVMFLDIGMPEVDGYRVAQAIRAEKDLANTLLIAITAYADPDSREHSRDVGFDFHLVKPVDPVLLERALA